MRESELLKRIRERAAGLPERWARVLVGPGDDCAAVAAEAAVELLTVDQLVEGRHFTAETPVDLVARKAVARSISDIAAMGGSARWALAAGVLSEGYPHGAELTEALHAWGERWGAPVVGGDLAFAPPRPGTPLVLSVTVGGVPHAVRGPVLRSGARPGDEVWVTGEFGNSLASGHHLVFEPRIAEGAWLCEVLGGDLHAMMDVSDGLGRDAGRIAEASGVRIELDGERVPRRPGAADAVSALRDGEDYELCFVTAPGVRLPSRAPTGAALTRVGRVVSGSGCVARLRSGMVEAGELGWDHG